MHNTAFLVHGNGMPHHGGSAMVEIEKPTILRALQG